MNRQGGYIIRAGISLLFVSGLLFFISAVATGYPSSSANDITVNDKPSAQVNISGTAVQGKTLFMSKCASCHNVLKDGTGPRLVGFTERGPWADRKNIYAWIRNPQKFMQTNEYTRELKKQFNAMMTAFPDMSNEEIDAVIDYINFAGNVKTTVVP